MSLKERINNKSKSEGLFVVVGGMRLDGKTTLAGTLPGKTLLLYAKVLETGSDSATALAKKNKHKLDSAAFDSLEDLVGLLQEAVQEKYDNIYIDGCSAVNYMKHISDEVQAAAKKNVWDSYALLADSMRQFLRLAKMISLDHGINVFITLSYKSTLNNNGDIIKLSPVLKGNITMSEIHSLVPIVLAVKRDVDEDGDLQRVLLTKSDAVYPARVDGLLDEDNPGILLPDLRQLFKLLGKDKK